MRSHSILLAVSLGCVLAISCSPTDVVDEFVDIPLANVGGTWNYQLDNPDQATFVNCTGDATVLEGKTWTEAQALAPICHVDVSFFVTQNLAAMLATPHNVTCSDGSSAVVTGTGIVGETTVDGQWDSTSDQNVDASQDFRGTVNGSTIALTEDRRDFGGSFQGSCDLSPALQSTVTVQ